MWATEVTNLLRGTSEVGNFPGYYGGAFPGAYPVELTYEQAIAAVLGAPDSTFLSLPGGEAPSGSAWPYAYVEVAFGAPFILDGTQLLTIELGANQESAQVWVWNASGGNVQFEIGRNGTDTIAVDLSPYAGIFADPYFTRIGIAGLDLKGASQGFDVDAIGVSSMVPEPASLLMLGAGLIGLLAARRRT
jgi:hypothetical protein